MCHDGSSCSNEVTQIQGSISVGGAIEGPNSYYVEQEAVQKNFACFNSDCSNDLTQIQVDIEGSESQKAEQYNIGCFDSTCTNEEVQLTDGTIKQYNIGCISSTCVNPEGSGNIQHRMYKHITMHWIWKLLQHRMRW